MASAAEGKLRRREAGWEATGGGTVGRNGSEPDSVRARASLLAKGEACGQSRKRVRSALLCLHLVGIFAHMNAEIKLAELGLTLPNPPAAAGSYVPTVRTGNLLYCAGTICAINGEMTHTGQVGKQQTVETGRKSAEICALNTLANIKAAIGSLDNVARVVMVNGFVNAMDGFTESPAVINGASDLFLKVFGEAGKHARAAVAVNGLPKGSTTEIQVLVEVKG
jgi:enamine deaminase RidA (YjgF/YER057c/UK114 family)